jgi:hypothetical protein
MQEEWKDIKGWEGQYKISSLRPKTSGRGKYHSISLCLNGLAKDLQIHRLVAEAFIPNPEGKPCVNHKDSNGLNNYVDNLEWCTYQENNHHAFRNNCKIKSPFNNKSGKFSVGSLIFLYNTLRIENTKEFIDYLKTLNK